MRFPGKEDVRVEEVEEPAPGPGEVKLRNAYAGICGSDLHVFYSPEASGLDFSRPHPVTGSTPPQILGHEFAGTVVADMLHKLPEAVDLRLGPGSSRWPWPGTRSARAGRGIADPAEVGCAYIEPNGLLSVVRRDHMEPDEPVRPEAAS